MTPLSKRAAALLEQYPGPVTIRTSKWFFVFAFGAFAVAAVPFVAILWNAWPRVLGSGQAIAILLVIVLIIGAVLANLVASSLKRLPKLVLDANGFALEGLFLSLRWPWGEVERFRSRILFVGFLHLSQPRTLWHRINSFGNDGRRLLFNAFELRSGELAPPDDRSPYGSSSVSQ